VIAWLRVRRAPMVALMVVTTALLVALFAEFLMPHDPEAINPAVAELPPAMLAGGDWAYLLGTDRLGRDIFSRVLLGTRVSLGIAAGAILIGAGIGTVLGMTAGYLGGITDAVIMRVADTFLAFPSVLMALVLAVAVGPSFGVVVLVLGLVLWARFARLVRSEVLSWKHRDFIALARIAGAGQPRGRLGARSPRSGSCQCIAHQFSRCAT
jgi:ABC-type dipeptide/oligopeptide/nickel transport system permease subunit